jgi:amino acid transporter
LSSLQSEPEPEVLTSATQCEPRESLTRSIGLAGATSANILTMVGIGPFITIPLMISMMGGPPALLGWFCGALIAFCDGLVWAELAAAMPRSGGSYHYLQAIYAPAGLGRLLSFLFLWQVVLVAPLFAATGAVGFAQYAAFLLPGTTSLGRWGIAAAACLVATVLIYRNSRAVERLSVAWCFVALGTLCCAAVIGLAHLPGSETLKLLHSALHPSGFLASSLGGATLIALSNFGGYQTVCSLGGEIKDPRRVLPHSILYSIFIVAILYLALSVAVLGFAPGGGAPGAVVSELLERIYGVGVARAATVLILWTALGSIFTILLGSSRVPYAAAVQGEFFPFFARIDPKRGFPSRAVVAMGLAAAACSVLPLETLIRTGMVVQVAIQSVTQCVGVLLIHRRRKEIPLHFRMWLYPVPVVVALCGWLWVLAVSGWRYVSLAALVITLGCGLFLLRSRHSRAVSAAP